MLHDTEVVFIIVYWGKNERCIMTLVMIWTVRWAQVFSTWQVKRRAHLGGVWPSAAGRGISEQLWHAHSEFGGCSECSARGGNWELFLSSCQTLRLPVQTALQPAAKEVWAWLASNFPGVVNNIMSLLQPK